MHGRFLEIDASDDTISKVPLSLLLHGNRSVTAYKLHKLHHRLSVFHSEAKGPRRNTRRWPLPPPNSAVVVVSVIN